MSLDVNLPRLGPQCSNYYRSLILAGRVTDPNYFIDEDGKIRYKFKSKTGDGMRLFGSIGVCSGREAINFAGPLGKEQSATFAIHGDHLTYRYSAAI